MEAAESLEDKLEEAIVPLNQFRIQTKCSNPDCKPVYVSYLRVWVEP